MPTYTFQDEFNQNFVIHNVSIDSTILDLKKHLLKVYPESLPKEPSLFILEYNDIYLSDHNTLFELKLELGDIQLDIVHLHGIISLENYDKKGNNVETETWHTEIYICFQNEFNDLKKRMQLLIEFIKNNFEEEIINMFNFHIFQTFMDKTSYYLLQMSDYEVVFLSNERNTHLNEKFFIMTTNEELSQTQALYVRDFYIDSKLFIQAIQKLFDKNIVSDNKFTYYNNFFNDFLHHVQHVITSIDF